jgi:hypothetical protein
MLAMQTEINNRADNADDYQRRCRDRADQHFFVATR